MDAHPHRGKRSSTAFIPFPPEDQFRKDLLHDRDTQKFYTGQATVVYTLFIEGGT